MPPSPTDSRTWDNLYEIAASQDGYFTTQQAGAIGYSPQLLAHHIRTGRLQHIRRGIYRLTHYPAGEHEELVIVWLWAQQAGVFSHETALRLHGLSDVLPAQIHIKLPGYWKTRRLRVPSGVVLHHHSQNSLKSGEGAWHGPVPITSVPQTLTDLARAQLSPEFLLQATRQALNRGLTTLSEIPKVEAELRPVGGISLESRP